MAKIGKSAKGKSPKKLEDLLIPLLVGRLERFLFFHILGIIIPTDELIFFRGVGQPPASITLPS